MNCQNIQRHLLENDPPDAAVAEHVRQCAACREYQRVLQATLAAVPTAPQPSAALDDAIRDAARRRQMPRPNLLRVVLTRWLPTAVAASLLLGGLALWNFTAPDDDSVPAFDAPAIFVNHPVDDASNGAAAEFAITPENVDNALLEAEISFSLYDAIAGVE